MTNTKTEKNTIKTSKGTVLPLAMLPRKKKLPNGQWQQTETPYLQVAHRLVWFREEHPDWRILTEITAHNKEKLKVIMKATIQNEKGKVIAMAHKTESAQSFSDYIEKAETGAVGRALAMCGYGTQYEPELDEGDRLADAPTTPAQKAAGKKEMTDEEIQDALSLTPAEKREAEEAQKQINQTRENKS